MIAGYVRGDRGIRQEPTSAHFHLCLISSMPSGVSISFSERKSSSSWRLICETPCTSKKSIGAAISHCSLGGGSAPCWKYGVSSSVSRASKYSVSLSTDTSSTVLSGTVGSVGSMSVSESSGSGDANEMNLFGVMSCCSMLAQA